MCWHWLAAAFLALALPAVAPAQDPPKDQEKDKDAGKTYSVPFHLTDSSHLMVRVKINGKGPFNFIVDTGAPLVYISIPTAKKIGLTTDPKTQVVLDRIDVEGGPSLTKFKCLVDTPFQIEGMNALGLAGVELHGILGYTLLAHYKLEIDLTKDRMKWTKLDFLPPAPESLGKGGNTPGPLDSMGKLMKFLAAIGGNQVPSPPAVRGFFGMELEDKGGAVVKSILSKCPVAAGGLEVGDVILAVDKTEVKTAADVAKALATVTPGQQVRLHIRRGNDRKELIVTAGEGL